MVIVAKFKNSPTGPVAKIPKSRIFLVLRNHAPKRTVMAVNFTFPSSFPRAGWGGGRFGELVENIRGGPKIARVIGA